MILDKENINSTLLKSLPNECNAEISLDRNGAVYENLCGKFTFQERNFGRQYAHIYTGRLNSMLSMIKKKCASKWGEVPVRKLSELAELSSERCIIIGTLFKHQDLKPSILRELSEENNLLPQPKQLNYVSSSDQLILEDEIQRIRLVGNIDKNKLVTGIVVALLGIENQDGHFEVEDFTFGNIYTGIQRNLLCISDASYILMVSGLDIGGARNLLPLQMLVDWVTGELGSLTDQKNQSKICRIVIAGNSVKRYYHSSGVKLINSEVQDYTDILANIKLLDKLLLNLVKNVDVDVMPGEFDPSNHTLPQQPLHQCIFPNSSQYNTFHRVTNPYECMIEGRRIIGTSGQPIADLKSLTDFTDDLSILENTLLWSHLAPTAPDTLDCYPYYEEDPFVITEQPDIYFVGNMSNFQTRLINLNDRQIRLVCLPVFAEKQVCAVVNLKTLECNPLQFKMFQ